MLVYQTNSQGIYVGTVLADESPLETGVWLVPAGCVETPPPAVQEGYLAMWHSNGWIVIPEPSVDSGDITPDMTEEQILEASRLGMRLSFAQLLIGLVTEQWITEAEGEAWLVGTLPTAVTDVIAVLPENQRFAAKARATRPSDVQRNDPLVTAMGAAANKTLEQLDEFFRTYAGV